MKKTQEARHVIGFIFGRCEEVRASRKKTKTRRPRRRETGHRLRPRHRLRLHRRPRQHRLRAHQRSSEGSSSESSPSDDFVQRQRRKSPSTQRQTPQQGESGVVEEERSALDRCGPGHAERREADRCGTAPRVRPSSPWKRKLSMSSFRKMFIGKLGEFKLLQEELRNRRQGAERQESIVTFIVVILQLLPLALTDGESRPRRGTGENRVVEQHRRPEYRSALCNRMPRIALKEIPEKQESASRRLWRSAGTRKRSESETILPLPTPNRHARRTRSRPVSEVTRRTPRRKKTPGQAQEKASAHAEEEKKRSETRPRKDSVAAVAKRTQSRRQVLANSTKQRRIPPAAQHAAGNNSRASSARVSPAKKRAIAPARMPATPLLPLPR
ncbi:unnamed protein product [Trichogramma brassicae]|uniref:Uncharacterized protein n=1 Tax=Trichogramma brassicae TaxID=86971 RepID=A0A6H5HXM3_9HYME|nr:unnamed protein product [Trichogramma brassicae]